MTYKPVFLGGHRAYSTLSPLTLKIHFAFFVLWYFDGLFEIPRERACFFDWFWIILLQIIIY